MILKVCILLFCIIIQTDGEDYEACNSIAISGAAVAGLIFASLEPISYYNVALTKECYMTGISGIQVTPGYNVTIIRTPTMNLTTYHMQFPHIFANCLFELDSNPATIPTFVTNTLMNSTNIAVCEASGKSNPQNVADSQLLNQLNSNTLLNLPQCPPKITLFPQKRLGNATAKWSNVKVSFVVKAQLNSSNQRDLTVEKVDLLSTDYENLNITCIGSDDGFKFSCNCLLSLNISSYIVKSAIIQAIAPCVAEEQVDNRYKVFLRFIDCDSRFN